MSALLQSLDALGADVFTVEYYDILGIIAENAGGLVLLQDNGRTIHVDFKRILFCYVKGTAQFDGKNDAAQLVHFSHDSS